MTMPPRIEQSGLRRPVRATVPNGGSARPLVLVRRRAALGRRERCLEIPHDLAQESRGQESGSERAGGILADGRQSPQSDSDRRRHVVELPADLRSHRVSPVGRDKPSGLRGVCGGAEGMGTHMRDGCGLSGRASSSCRCRVVCLARWDTTNEAAADPLCDAELAASECTCACDQVARTAVPWDSRLEDRQDVLSAIRRPSRDGTPVGFAERLRGAHTAILSSRITG
jgi:hypothetical protein